MDSSISFGGWLWSVCDQQNITILTISFTMILLFSVLLPRHLSNAVLTCFWLQKCYSSIFIVAFSSVVSCIDLSVISSCLCVITIQSISLLIHLLLFLHMSHLKCPYLIFSYCFPSPPFVLFKYFFTFSYFLLPISTASTAIDSTNRIMLSYPD